MEAMASDSGEQAHRYTNPSSLSLPFLHPAQSIRVLIDEISFPLTGRGFWVLGSALSHKARYEFNILIC
jgi:hypothetical protein